MSVLSAVVLLQLLLAYWSSSEARLSLMNEEEVKKFEDGVTLSNDATSQLMQEHVKKIHAIKKPSSGHWKKPSLSAYQPAQKNTLQKQTMGHYSPKPAPIPSNKPLPPNIPPPEKPHSLQAGQTPVKPAASIPSVSQQQRPQHYTEEILAQSICMSLATSRKYTGLMYAVGRSCSAPNAGTCKMICSNSTMAAQDVDTRNKKWSCYGAYYVYPNRPSTNPQGTVKTAVLGLKVRHESCSRLNCGPNFCCCRVY